MLRFITGQTGGGKTKFATALVIDELRETDRPIVLSMALRLHPWVNGKGTPYPGLLHILESVYGSTFDAERRIYFLSEPEIPRFFAVRLRIPSDPSEPREVVTIPTHESGRWVFDAKAMGVGGCCFIIDEAHEYFRQSDWAKIGTETQSWASQNRRSGDDAWLLTQQAELVAKPFRRQSLECYWMVNLAYKQLGWFRREDRIKYYLHVNTPPNPSDKPLRTGGLTYPRGRLEACYDTAGGAGVRGACADIGKRAKGLSMGWIPILFVGVVALLVMALSGCRTALENKLSGKKSKPGAAPVAVVAAPPAPSGPGSHSPGMGPVLTEPAGSSSRLARLAESTNAVVIGWGGLPPKIIVQFAGGRYETASEVIPAGGHVVVDGVLYKRR